jgi:fibronectin type 3 domain-containing protein
VLNVSWTAPSQADVAGYTVFKDGIAVGDVTATAWSDSDADANATYSVVAYDEVPNFGAASDATDPTFGHDETAPLAPADLAAADHPGDDGGAVDLSWTASAEAATYNVYRDGALINTVALAGATSWTDPNATVNVTYAYTVTAVDAAGNESSASNEAPGTSRDDKGTDAPVLSVTVVPTGNTLALDWDEPADAATYDVYCNGSKIDEGLTASAKTYSGLVDGDAYTYYVIAFDAAGNPSAGSNHVTETPADTTAPGVPFAVLAEDVSADEGGALKVSWSAPGDADVTAYEVYRDGLVSIGTTADLFLIDSAAGADAHFYTVVASDEVPNASAASAPSLPATAADNVGPDAPTGVTVTDPTDDGGVLVVSWTAPSQADVAGYKVFRDGIEIADQTGRTLTDSAAGTARRARPAYSLAREGVEVTQFWKIPPPVRERAAAWRSGQASRRRMPEGAAEKNAASSCPLSPPLRN